MKQREKFKSRLGFLLLSAGCAIGIGNVWRFPYVVGANGGGAFVLFYLLFLVIMGVPVLSMEFAVGRASRKSPVKAYQELEKPGQKWHLHGYIALFGNYMLMMFYTTVAGWMLYYFYSFFTGRFDGETTEGVQAAFGEMLASPGVNVFWMVLVVIIGIFVCSMGLQKGVERITKTMMIGLLSLMIILAVRGVTLDGGLDGLKFYLLPDFGKMAEVGIGNVLSNIQPLGAGTQILDLEDFIVSNLLLPLGSLVYLVFCTWRCGWGFENYQTEANMGTGLQVPKWCRVYVAYILPVMIFGVFFQGIWGYVVKFFG